MKATTEQLAALRNRRIAITSAADEVDTLIIDQSSNLTMNEAARLYGLMEKIYDRLDDMADMLLDVEERSAD